MPGSLTIEQCLAILAATPSSMAAITSGLDPAQLLQAPRPGEWPALAMLGHVRASCESWGGYALAALAQDTPTLRQSRTLEWLKSPDFPEHDFASSLQAFAAGRATLLAALQPLAPAGWARSATVVHGRRRSEHTVLDFARQIARHDRTHLAQLKSIARAVRGSEQFAEAGELIRDRCG